jgi:hypothetical protein
VVDVGLWPIRFFNPPGEFRCGGEDGAKGTHPAAGAAVNATLGVDDMNLMAFTTDCLCGAGANASLAAATVFGNPVRHFRTPDRPSRVRSAGFGLEPRFSDANRCDPKTYGAWQGSPPGFPGAARSPVGGCPGRAG